MCNVLYLIVDASVNITNSSVLKTQVLDKCLILKKNSVNIDIISNYDSTDDYNNFLSYSYQDKLDIFLYNTCNIFYRLHFVIFSLFRIKKSNYDCIYVRNVWSGILALLVKYLFGIPYIYDVRGDIIDESINRNNSSSYNYKIRALTLLESLIVKNCSILLSVSKLLSKIVLQRSNIFVRNFVIPSSCNYENKNYSYNRKTNRNLLCVNDNDFLCVYSGGISSYQMLNEMFALWEYIYCNCNNIKFVFLTNNNPQIIKDKVSNYKFKSDITITSQKPQDIYKYLCASDVSFMLREDRQLNNVSSPVKFSQYLSCNLPVITSKNIGDISYYVSHYNIGFLINPSLYYDNIKIINYINQLKQDRTSCTKRIKSLYNKYYFFDNHIKTYKMLFNSLKQLSYEF